MNKGIIKDTLALFFITLLAGILLGTVYEITKAPIENQTQIRKENAYKEVFSTGEEFVEFDCSNQEAVLSEGEFSQAEINQVMEVFTDGNLAGYVMTATTHEGYGGDIQFAIGIQKDGTVNGISILSISETAGLGMKAKDEAFGSQFANKKVDGFVYTKSGAVGENEIDAISGATITTNAVTNGVNACLYYFKQISANGEGGTGNE